MMNYPSCRLREPWCPMVKQGREDVNASKEVETAEVASD